jgi:hypothetical protein
MKFCLDNPNIQYFLRLTIRPDGYAYFELAEKSYMNTEQVSWERNVVDYLL